MNKVFMLSNKTKLIFCIPMTNPILNIRDIFNRDRSNALEEASPECPENEIIICYTGNSSNKASNAGNNPGIMPPESFLISFSSAPDQPNRMHISAADELGVVYALLHISRTALEVPPFWFYNDYTIPRKPFVLIDEQIVRSPDYKVRYRGWFINDEVLTTGWHTDKYDPAVWKPAFEALLRCGGNVVVPGTGVTHKYVEKMAVEMGLMLTQHHAEPLGAEMFSAAFPDKEASYDKYPELFEKLWRDAIINQKDIGVIWTLGFRGQGDCPFWVDDPSYATPRDRGALISKLIKRQYDILREYIEHPVCCTNLYGEIMELYKAGYIHVPEDVIKIWADSGYGKMVSRRQWNVNPRIPALPEKGNKDLNGLYYHVTFHDLQASNHLTMLPNSPGFVLDELTTAFSRGADTFLLINSGNIRMHAYTLDFTSRIWQAGVVDIDAHCDEYAVIYHPEAPGQVADCIHAYFDASIQYGSHDDEKAGEQFYHYPARSIISHWIKGNSPEPEDELSWAINAKSFPMQVEWFENTCRSGLSKWQNAYDLCQAALSGLSGSAQLFKDSLLLQTKIHLSGCTGLIKLCESYMEFMRNNPVKAFMLACESMNAYRESYNAQQAAAHDKWAGFYRNDCLTNLKLTVHFTDILRKYIRVLGETSLFLDWERRYVWPDSVKRILLQTTVTAQLNEDDLYTALKDNMKEV